MVVVVGIRITWSFSSGAENGLSLNLLIGNHDKLGKSTGRYGFYWYDKCEYLWGNRYIFITHLDDVVVKKNE